MRGEEGPATLSDFVSPILDLIDEFGLLALFVFLVLDAAMLLPLVPGELLLILAATRFATDRATLAFVVVVATAAATLGNLLLYGIARGGGRRLVENHPRLFLMSPPTRDRLERLFQRPWGQSLVLLLRVVPLFRLLVNLPAGLARMPVVRFVILSAIGNLAFHVGFMYVAYESRQPGSTVALRAQALQDAYTSPAWDYVRANWLVVGGAVLTLGILLSLRASARTARVGRGQASGSLLGTLATVTLFWGGLALLVGLWTEPDLIYEGFRRAGYDLLANPPDVPYAPASVVAGLGALSTLLALLLYRLRQEAQERRKRARERAAEQRLSDRIGSGSASRRTGR